MSALASAQLPLPSVRLPVPAVSASPAADLQSAQSQLRLPDPRTLRTLHIRELLRSHREVIEADPHGNPIVRGEVVLVDPDAATLAAAAARGLAVARDASLEPLGLRLVLLRGSAAAARSLEAMRAIAAGGVGDFNHIYLQSAAQAPGGKVTAAAPAAAVPAAADGQAVRVGLIDGGVDVAHEVFRGVDLHRHGCPDPHSPDAHGTATASLLVGRSSSLHGAAAGAELYAADVYCGAPQGGAVFSVAEAFAWLAQQHVPVINISLVGPPNSVLETVVRRVISQGHLVVAAVGNDGPAAPPLYPAAWPGVIGVTAVDEHRRVLPEAGRGPQVMFAAPGARLAAARAAGGYVLVRGTSFAAPLVAGLLAARMQAPDAAAAARAVAVLVREAVPLGVPGRDPVYGYGLVGESLRRQPALAALHAD